MVGQFTYDVMNSGSKRRLLQDFENQVKRPFDPHRFPNHTLDLRGVADDKEKGVEDGEIYFPSYIFSTLRRL